LEVASCAPARRALARDHAIDEGAPAATGITEQLRCKLRVDIIERDALGDDSRRDLHEFQG
jgi:hypothetical protein